MTSCHYEKDLLHFDDISVPEISVHQLHQKANGGESFFLLDVRTQEEYETARLEFSGIRIPYDSLDKFLHLVPLEKKTVIYCFCRRGRRSAVSTAELISHGYTNVFNVTGGINVWVEAGYATIGGAIENSTGEE